MQHRTLLTASLCAVLALPTFAQQTNSGSSAPATAADQNASMSQNMTATGQPPLQTTHPQNFWDGDEPGLAWLVLHPYASKEYVKRHLQAVQDRLNELDGLTASNSKMINDVDSRAQHGIQLASAKSDEADQHAMDASNKAQMAQQSATAANQSLTKVETVVGNVDQFKATTQTVIKFHSGQSVLSKDAKQALDEMAAGLKDQHGYVIEVQGFAPGSGQAAMAASRKMASSVERYLVLNQEIPAYRIYVMGLGNASVSGADGSTGKRVSGSRVEISVLKNDIDQLASK